MKVKNLYVGSIYMVIKVDYLEAEYGDIEIKRIANFSRKTVCYHLSNHSKKIIDVLYNDMYQIGADDLEVGNCYATDFFPISPSLVKIGYRKKNITKHKLVKLLGGNL